MPTLTWREEFDVNVKQIDDQHRQLLELVTRLHASVEDRIDKQELRRMLVELLEFTRMHFATEEELMKEYAYPEFTRHHSEHKLLLRYMKQMVDGVSKGKYPTFYSDYDLSTDWALVHIEEHDRDLGAFLNAKDVF